MVIAICDIATYILVKPYIKETKLITLRNIKSADQSYTEFLMSISSKRSSTQGW